MALEALPYEFRRKHADFSWLGLHYGFVRGWITEADIESAADAEIQSKDIDDDLLILSMPAQSDQLSVRQALERKAASCEGSECDERLRWLLLGLQYLFENQDRFAEPLAVAEDMLFDVDFPDVSPNWYRIFSSKSSEHWDPMAHSLSENLARLDRNWRTFLERYKAKYLKNV